MKLSLLFLTLVLLYTPLKAKPNKRETFCHQNRCLTCIGRYCTTTCQGDDCTKCPLGDCCNGQNCNICRGDACCESPECNNCVNTCLKKCLGKTTCHYDCFQECLPSGGKSSGGNNKNYDGIPLISNHNYVPVNVTTIINITNSIINENDIHNPILINTTNVNNYTSDRKSYHRKHVILSGSRKVVNQTKQNCCEVVHPEKCSETVPRESSRLCFTGKHSECSQICIGKHVHIIEDEKEKYQCVTIAKEPFFFCGPYVVENCDSCYSCINTDDPNCEIDSPCSDRCKSSIIDEHFYNKAYRRD